ncbi:MAG: aminoglycoside phosphotransferase family protein [Sphingopyxis sp.]|uniref:phosphotransferase family protein n=1 Tax=Sphingopyxis sp. TaxID=1908224 RepID=UPI002AB903B5|nr:aminoglycoside phosphotransferase family protein [Sphingopyxis sp.]MDZ3830293.1 aminoglycoside phosphotransferase family protein [Sphingopyxis sp.]
MSFPTAPDAMNAAWLGAALGAEGQLRGFTATRVGTGQMCDSYRLALHWEKDGAGPASIIAKCPSQDAASRHIARLTGTYVKEVNWYRALAAESGVSAPACHFHAIAADEVEFLLLLSDLAPARQGDQLAGTDLAGLVPCIDAAASLHAYLWDDPRLDGLDWLARDNGSLVRTLFPQLYQGFRERYASRLDTDVLDLGAGLVERLDAYLARVPAAPTLVHGDLRIDNILFAPDSARCWLVDWQTLGRGSGAADLAYLVGTSIADPGDRAAADHPAFDHWIAALADRGIEADRAALWTDYRVGALSGYFMAVFASMSVERTARGDEMFAVMAERPARQALALGSLDLL